MNKERGLIYGGIIGDVLGVPFEFMSREEISEQPFLGQMTSGGVHGQPLGYWSDDTSMTLCLVDAMVNNFTLERLALNFIKWESEGFLCAGDKLFDIGRTTRYAIDKLKFGASPLVSGQTDFYSNGNGSLMRISPLYFIFRESSDDFRMQIVSNVSGITHRHPISIYSCYFYLLFLEQLSKFENKYEAFAHTQFEFKNILRKTLKLEDDNYKVFSKILDKDFPFLSDVQIFSSGYVVHTLESAIWCFLNSNSFGESVMKAINLGEDTDTVASVCGSLSGYFFGFDNIPSKYLDQLPKKNELDQLINQFLLRFLYKENYVFNTR
jgi:ADP-ribosylglycohydrolase